MKNLTRLFVKIGCVITMLFLSTALYAEDYNHKISLRNMSFEWTLEGKMIRIRLKGETKGWIAIGFNPDRKMKGADFIIGYVKRGKVEIQDAYGIGFQSHIRDIMNSGTDNIKDVSGSEKRGWTTLEFAIPLNTGDQSDSVINPDAPTKVLLAYGPDRDSFSPRHVFRTAITVNLKTGQ